MTSELARSLDVEQVTGALVSDVQPGGPGEKGGLERGDVITAINGEPVRDGNVLRNHVAELQPGTRGRAAGAPQRQATDADSRAWRTGRPSRLCG